MKIYNVLSLGAGVQSSTMALMAEKGELPKPDFAVFADTQAEPKSVYDWLEYLKTQVSYPIYTVTHKNLTEESLKIRYAKSDGKWKKKGDTYLTAHIPFYGIKNNEVTAAIGRKCTSDFKIKPIHKFIREKCNIKRGQKEVTVRQYIGISYDEMQRMRISQVPFIENLYPLVDMKIRRHQCLEWMQANGYPEPPRSACVYCPFHSDTEWRRLRNEEPEEFKRAVHFDKKLRLRHNKYNPELLMTPFLHCSCKPLDEVDFDNDIDKGQQVFDFESECEGMCGL